MDRFSVTYSHASTSPETMEVFDDIAKGYGMDVDCCYDMDNDETVYRFWFEDLDLARDLFTTLKKEMRADEIRKGTARLFAQSELNKWGH